MLKKIVKLLALAGASHYGHRHGPYSHKPWKRRKWRGHEHGPYGGYDYPPPPPYGYGPGHAPYGYGRPRGLKGLIVEAILQRLFRHR